MNKSFKRIVNRMNTLFLLFLLFSFYLIWKIFFIQNFESRDDLNVSIETIKKVEIKSARGNIYSDNGDLIVSNISKYELRWDSKIPTSNLFNSNIDSLSKKLSNKFSSSKDYFKKFLTQSRIDNNRYVLIGKNLSISDVNEIKSYPIFKEGLYKGGLITIENHFRESHIGKIAERTIGYERLDDEGNYLRVGLEGAYTEYLSGKSGLRLMQKIADGQWKPITSFYERDPVKGYDIHTTIDTEIQDIVHFELLKQLENYEADHGTMIVMETDTGKIKAISNLGRTDEGKYYEKLNYAIGESHEPGSTFKLMTLVSALEDGVIKPEDSIDTGNGVLKFYNKYEVRDSNKKGYGKITVAKAFEVSSNTGMVKLIFDNYKDNPERLVNRLYNMKINERLNLDIVGEGLPKIPHPSDKEWNGISLPWMAFGYGVSLTPLQTLTFYNSIANDGEMVKPSFISRIGSFGENPIYEIKKEVIIPSLCSNETLNSVRNMLLNVVEKPWGTAHNIYDKNLSIAGKTGTCQVDYTSNETQYISSFVGYFPAENPKYSSIVVIHKPNKSMGYYGGTVAAPVFKKVAQKIINNIPTEVKLENKNLTSIF